MKINKERKKTNLKKIRETKIHAISHLLEGSFAVHIGDHLRFGIICSPVLGITFGLGIICGAVQL